MGRQNPQSKPSCLQHIITPHKNHQKLGDSSDNMRSLDFYFPGAEALMPLDVPLLKVSRPIAACQRCRGAKIKCDGKLPACTACEKSGRAKQCSSGNSQFAPGKERSYVSTLEARVDKLESRIAEARRQRQASITQFELVSPITPLSRSSTLDSLGRPANRKAKFRKELGTVDELVADFGFLTVNATARDYQYGFTNAISYARLILAAASKESLPSGMKKDLPPRSIALPLVKTYVKNLLCLHPILDEQEIYRSLDAMTGNDSSNATAMDAWTIRMILAIVSTLQSRQRGDTLYTDAIGHVCTALDVADQVLHPGSIWSIQAMLLLVQFSMLDPAHFDSWTLIGAASRAMIDLGLHQDPSKASKTIRQKIELRRRVFYSVYCLDRVTSIVQNRAFSFSDDSASVTLPFTHTQTSEPSSNPTDYVWTKSTDFTRAFIEWRKLQSVWYTELYQSSRAPWPEPYEHIWKYYHDMSTWLRRLPASTPPLMRDFLELDVLYSYVCILGPTDRCPQPSEHAQRLLVHHATTYIESIKTYQSSNASGLELPLFTFYDALRAYSVARQYIDTLSSNLEVHLQPTGADPWSIAAMHADEDMDSGFKSPDPSSPPVLSPTQQDSIHTIIPGLINTINTFLTVLSTFGQRFGSISEMSWRDRLQNEAQPLLNELQSRLPRHDSASSASSSSYFWPTAQAQAQSGPITPTIPLDASPQSQRLSASFYPSPATTTYSDNHSSQTADVSKGADSAWQQHHHHQNSAPVGSLVPTTTQTYSNVPLMNEFGIANAAAWETLPGGSMNVRFS